MAASLKFNFFMKDIWRDSEIRYGCRIGYNMQNFKVLLTGYTQ